MRFNAPYKQSFYWETKSAGREREGRTLPTNMRRGAASMGEACRGAGTESATREAEVTRDDEVRIGLLYTQISEVYCNVLPMSKCYKKSLNK